MFQALSTVLHTIMFEDCRNQWSMSRPLLGLILLNEEVLDAWWRSSAHKTLVEIATLGKVHESFSKIGQKI